jgi:hypothetical protein
MRAVPASALSAPGGLGENFAGRTACVGSA